MQQPEQLQKELDEVRANTQRLTVQATSSAQLAEQLLPHVRQLEQLASAPGAFLIMAEITYAPRMQPMIFPTT